MATKPSNLDRLISLETRVATLAQQVDHMERSTTEQLQVLVQNMRELLALSQERTRLLTQHDTGPRPGPRPARRGPQRRK
jgi:hypothetical protein